MSGHMVFCFGSLGSLKYTFWDKIRSFCYCCWVVYKEKNVCGSDSGTKAAFLNYCQSDLPVCLSFKSRVRTLYTIYTICMAADLVYIRGCTPVQCTVVHQLCV